MYIGGRLAESETQPEQSCVVTSREGEAGPWADCARPISRKSRPGSCDGSADPRRRSDLPSSKRQVSSTRIGQTHTDISGTIIGQTHFDQSALQLVKRTMTHRERSLVKCVLTNLRFNESNAQRHNRNGYWSSVPREAVPIRPRLESE